MGSALPAGGLSGTVRIVGGVAGIEIESVQSFLCDAQDIGEALVVDNFPLTQEFDVVAHPVTPEHYIAWISL